ncbi:MAG: thioredoxin family protein [Bacteroidales bacterium]|nr:thioredoxin family protein [Bacteroidales bacterium]
MKLRTILVAAAASVLASCSSNENAVIELNVPGAGGKEVVLSKLQVNTIAIVDTLDLDANGNAKGKVNVKADDPDFFYLSYNQKRLASLLLKGGDRVKVSVDTLGGGLTVTGSDETSRLIEIEKTIYDASAKFDAFSTEIADALEKNDTERIKEIQVELSKFFVNYKRGALAQMMKQPASLSNIMLLYQRFSDELPLFGDVHDLVYFRSIHDSLKQSLPNSKYVRALKEEVDKYQKAFEFNNKLTLAGELAFPEIEMADTKGQNRKMSELLGKPFILVFWTSTIDQQKMFNHDLKELYSKYNPKGLEIYQVSADVDKTQWATVVKEQALPWINVCDGRGTACVALNTYAVTQLPTLILFDKSGNIVAKNIFDKAALDRELGKLSY